GKHGETPEPFPLPKEVSIVQAAAGWAHCVCVAVGGDVYTWGWKECVPSGKVIGDPNSAQSQDNDLYQGQNPFLTEQVSPRSQGSRATGVDGKAVGDESTKRRRVSSTKQVVESSSSGDEPLSAFPCLVALNPGVRIATVAAGGRHTLALSDVGQVWGWGYGGEGQLGLGSRIRMVSSPHPIPCIASSSAGKDRSAGIPRGTMVSEGQGYRVPGSYIKAIACGGRHSAVITDAGALMTFGWGLYGQVTSPWSENVLSFLEVKGSILTPYKAGGPFLPTVEPEAASLPLVGVGLSTSQPPPYTVEDGIGTHNPWKTVLGVTYLLTFAHACGQGSTDDELSPTCVSSLLGMRIDGVAAGLWHTLCISADGDVYAFGGNQFGQLGTGTDQAETLPRLLDAPSLENEHARVVSCGARHSAVVTDGKVFCWGWNKYGQLGLGDVIDRNIPSQVTLEGCVPRVAACGSSNMELSFRKSLYYKYLSGPVFSSYDHIQIALKLPSRSMTYLAVLVVYNTYAFLLVNGSYAAIVRCPNCGTTPIPYPLGTGPKCGQQSYKIQCDGNVLKFDTRNDTYPIISISAIDQRIVIQRSNLLPSTCVTSNLSTHDIQLNTFLPFTIAHINCTDPAVELMWAPPPEPQCRTQACCDSTSICRMAHDGTLRCFCKTKFHWDAVASQCASDFMSVRPKRVITVSTTLCSGVTILLSAHQVMEENQPRFSPPNRSKEQQLTSHQVASLWLEGLVKCIKACWTVAQQWRLNVQYWETPKALNEVRIPCQVNHKNLVHLLGGCVEKQPLVYEFIPNGSLFDHLHGQKKQSLTWSQRLVLLEILTCQKAVDFGRPTEDVNLVAYVKQIVNEEKMVDAIDTMLKRHATPLEIDAMKAFGFLAMSCLEERRAIDLLRRRSFKNLDTPEAILERKDAKAQRVSSHLRFYWVRVSKPIPQRLRMLVLVAFLVVHATCAVAATCPNCGTTPVPYPLSTGPTCGRPLYKILCDKGVLKFNTLNNTYPITSISAKTQRLVIQPPGIIPNTCIMEDYVFNGIQLNASLPFTITDSNTVMYYNCSELISVALDCSSTSPCVTYQNTVENYYACIKTPRCCSYTRGSYTNYYFVSTTEDRCRAYTSFVNLDESLSINKYPDPGVELMWALPGEPRCTTQAQCDSTSTCKDVQDGKRRCICKSKLRWDAVTGQCIKDLRKAKSKHIVIVATTVCVGVITFVTAVYGTFAFIRRQRIKAERQRLARERVEIVGASVGGKSSKIFTSKEIKRATNNFSSSGLLGAGGFGEVYKGVLDDGTPVAVKCATLGNTKSIDQVLNEVRILCQVNHKNLVLLLGCCVELEQPFLVYEYVPNGSLYDHMHGRNKQPLTWAERLGIAHDTAEGLTYLHFSASPPIYHRDIKSSNILLDTKMRAKVADFGLSRLAQTDVTHVTTCAQGTLGYLDPDYYWNYQLTDKSDVYSFGVLLLEILTCQKAIDFTRPTGDVNLAQYIKRVVNEERLVDAIDPMLKINPSPLDMDAMKAFGFLAMSCIEEHRENRPSMKEVAEEIEYIMGIVKITTEDHLRDS
nr:wall-associated receptor kinase-like 20 [Tanacetum cinerariifolium]